MEIIYSPLAPNPVGPYSQAVISHDTLYVSGQIPLDVATGKLINDPIEKAAKQVMENIGHILKAAHLSYSSIVKCTIFLLDMNDFSAVNQVYETYFPHNPPARETVSVTGLPKGARIEISCIAQK